MIRIKYEYPKNKSRRILNTVAKKLTFAKTIEKKILNDFKHLVTNESLLRTTGSEIFKEDVLKLDIIRF